MFKDDAARGPLISVIMANYQGGRYIERAIGSVLAQTMDDLEVIVSDDDSTDDSVAVVARLAASDPRLRLVRADQNGGPARCRNRALAQARGNWIAVVDSDDLIHPERFARLLAEARRSRADIVADDLLHFYEDGSPSRLLLPEDQDEPIAVGAAQWILAGSGGTPALGYIKPLIRASLLRDVGYDEALTIGEDYDLLLRLLLRGGRLSIVPEPWYLYRRHDGSYSHRLSRDDLKAMMASQRRFMAAEGPFPADVAAAFRQRMSDLRRALRFEELVAGIKAHDPGRTAGLLARHPSLIFRLMNSASEHVSRKTASPATPTGSPVRVVLSEDPTMVDGDTVTIHVPAHDPPEVRSAGGAVRRRTWLQVADLGRLAPLRIVSDGPAGEYAAGFLPALLGATEGIPEPVRTELVDS
jgi:succinoglycan biosynthesis protein ExoO